MKSFIIFIILPVLFLYGCKNASTHDHSDKITENHEGHNHENENAGHGDEIIFTKKQARQTDFKVEEIQPGVFHQVIKTSGQILPAPGDESALVATNNGIISFANHKLTAGSAVHKGQILFHIASKTSAKEITIPGFLPTMKKQPQNTNGHKNWWRTKSFLRKNLKKSG